jgi:hypothetical protein
MPTVLLPSDDRAWILNFVHGYKQLGFDVVTGALNFEIDAFSPDILHLNWPEELTNWNCPKRAELPAVLDRLERWSRRTNVILSVNNLYPKASGDKSIWRELYLGAYRCAHVIHHFSEGSKNIVCREFPEIADRNHVVRLGFNYERLLADPKPDRNSIRSKLGLSSDDFVLLAFGKLRGWNEVLLLKDGFSRARIKNKKLIFAARYRGNGDGFSELRRRIILKIWLQSGAIEDLSGFIPEEDVPALFSASDAVLVVREEGLGSGIPSLAMTLGRLVIAPEVGIIPEFISGTKNILFNPKIKSSLAQSIEMASRSDCAMIGINNSIIAGEWSWCSILRDCLDALPRTKL